MKRIVLLLGAAAILAVTLYAQYIPPIPPVHIPMCHDEMICTGVYGCRWITICN